MSFLKHTRDHLKRRLLIGLVVLAPFGLTIWILIKLIQFGKEQLTKPINLFLDPRIQNLPPDIQPIFLKPSGEYVWWLQYSALVISIILTLTALYLIGLISATIAGRRSIALGERLLLRIPGAQFFYNTIKQVAEILSRPRSRAFQKVVLVEYPRRNSWCIAFFTGVTVSPTTGKPLVNVFLPSTPNPTTGFLMVMEPEEVYLTNLTVAQASRFLFSFGVVEIAGIQSEPFPIDDYYEPGGEERVIRAGATGNNQPTAPQALPDERPGLGLPEAAPPDDAGETTPRTTPERKPRRE